MAAPPMLDDVPVPAPDALLLAWFPVLLAEEARQRHAVTTGVDDVIAFCETAIAKLQEASATLLQAEPGDAAETIYDAVLEVASPGLYAPLLEPTARLVDTLFNGPGPLVGAIAVAGDLVTGTFYFPLPDGGPLQAALRDLGYLIHVPHANAGHLFTAYAANLGVLPGEDTWQRWADNQDQARARATVALERLNDAVRLSLAADIALRLCQGEWEERLPPRERMAAAELMLQQTISRVGVALAALRAMRINLVELEQIVVIATGQAPPPP